jgi:hypothetical protein
MNKLFFEALSYFYFQRLEDLSLPSIFE